MSRRPWEGRAEVARQAALIDRLAAAVEADGRWRWLEVSCSLGRGDGDERSDVDAGVGYAGLGEDELAAAGLELVRACGEVVDVLVHVLDGWPSTARRFAAEYADGVQLDLVLLPAERRPGLPDGSVAVVDRDGRLATLWRPPVADPPSPEQAREWALLGWWAVGDAGKYLARGSLFEAAERITDARAHALRLWATGRRIPYPAFGLVSALDFDPYELPAGLAATYCVPEDAAAVRAAAVAVADLLAEASTAAGAAIGADLSTPWSATARRRLPAT